MSVVIAYKDGKGAVWMGADTQCSCGGTFKRRLPLGAGVKLCRLENGILIGRVGSLPQHQHVLSHPEWFTLTEDGVLTKEHLVTHLVPKLFSLCKEQNFFEKEDGEPVSASFQLLIAHGDRLFFIDDGLHVRTVADRAAIGAGAPFLRLAMARIDKERPVEEEMLRMLHLSAHCSTAVSAPFVLMNTADDTCYNIS